MVKKNSEPVLTLTRPVVLVGLMGAGKTTIGRRLAHRLGLPFVDADEEIERAADCSVAEIFERFGEDAFRDGERRVIRRLISEAPQVVATGGGAFVDDQTRALILDRGIAIWLQADVDVLVERTSRRSTRPLLNQGNPAQILAELAEKRHPFYIQAPIHVSSGRGPHEATIGQILAKLKQLDPQQDTQR